MGAVLLWVNWAEEVQAGISRSHWSFGITVSVAGAEDEASGSILVASA